MSKLEPVPDFASEAGARAFWHAHDASEFACRPKAERVRLPDLEPSTRSMSLRLPQGLLDDRKIAAHGCYVPNLSLIKVWPAERPAEEGKPRPKGR